MQYQESQRPDHDQYPFASQHRLVAAPGLRLMLALFLAAIDMSMAHASDPNCPTPPCRPAPRNGPTHEHAHAPLTATSYAHGPATTYAKSPPHPIVKEKVPGIGPVAPGPTHALSNTSNTANKQGSILGGGKNALNPQPIPPGHSPHPVPPVGAPTENTHH